MTRSFLVLACFGVAMPAWGAVSDFFCRAGKTTQVRYFKFQAQGCDKTLAKKTEGVCQQTVVCAYVSPEIQRKVAESAGTIFPELKGNLHTYQTLTEAQRARLLEKEALNYRPSYVYCPANNAAEGETPTCPPPDECKGDVLVEGGTTVTKTVTKSGAQFDPTGASAAGSAQSGGSP